jgi:hypothetical protein
MAGKCEVDAESRKLAAKYRQALSENLKMKKELKELKDMIKSLSNRNTNHNRFAELATLSNEDELNANDPEIMEINYSDDDAANNSFIQVKKIKTAVTNFDNTSIKINKSKNIPVDQKQNQNHKNIPANQMQDQRVKSIPMNQKEERRQIINIDKRCPPIVVNTDEVVALKKTITEKIKIEKSNFLIKSINKNKHIIYSNSFNDLKKMREGFDKEKIQFYTYSHKEEKPINLVLKDLYGNYDCQDILGFLKELETDKYKFMKVLRLSTRKTKINNQTLPIYIVQATAGSEVSEIFNIKYIENCKVRWEKLKKGEYSQCMKCQRFGHSAYNCHMNPRCVKCGEEHLAQDCKIAKESPKSNLKCVLCNKEGHPASYRNCPIHVKLQEKIKAKKEERVEKQVRKLNNNSFDSKIIKNVTFSNILRNTTNTNSPNVNNENTNNLILEGIQKQLTNFSKILEQLDKNFSILCESNSIMQKQIQADSERIDFLFTNLYD